MLKMYNVTFDTKITLKPNDEKNKKDGQTLNDAIINTIKEGLNVTYDQKIKEIVLNNVSLDLSIALQEEGDSDNLVKDRPTIESTIINILEEALNITYDGSISGIELKNVHYRAGSEKDYREFKEK